MRTQNISLYCLLVLLSVLVSQTFAQKVVCYLGSWATYRPGDGRFEAEYVDPSLCTHVIYSFVGIGGDGEVKILDTWNDLSTNGGKGAINRFNALKTRNPKLKTIVAIGGWNQGSTTFSSVVNNYALRRKFVNSAVAFLKQYGFDGFDLDWEYPAQRGGSPSDKSAFSQLIKELRAEFDKYGYLLSAAVPASPVSIETSYDVVSLGKYLDFINLMTYDFHGSWDSVTGHNAPLNARSSETGLAAGLNDHASVQYWIKKGVPRSKLILGIPSYGRTWTLRTTSNTGLGAPAGGPGNPGIFTSEAGMIGYNELCLDIKQGGWMVRWDDEQKVPYAVKGNQWISYDNPESVKIKAKYALNERLGGVMLWSLETDDFRGLCDGVKFSFLKVVNDVLQGGENEAIPSIPIDQEPEDSKKYENNGKDETETSTDICKVAGYQEDPSDCSKFYQCVQGFEKIIPNQMQCPAGLAFDRRYLTCNYRYLVDC